MKKVNMINQSGDIEQIIINTSNIVSIEKVGKKLQESLKEHTNGPFSQVVLNEGGQKRQIIVVGTPSSINESNGDGKQILHG